MKIDRITYQKIFPTGMMYQNHKIGVEVQVDENDDWEEAFNMAKTFVEAMNKQSNPFESSQNENFYGAEFNCEKDGLYKMSNGNAATVVQQTTPHEEKINAYIATINLCKTKDNLSRFQKRIEEEKNDRLTVAYNKKLAELENNNQ